MLAFIFPGQGSQVRGMGRGLFDEVREFVSIEPEIDKLFGYSIRKLCLEDQDNQLKQTQYTQPALFIVNALHYYKANAEGERPDFVAGHSVGEYNALLAAGAFDFFTGIRLVQKRGEIMSRAKNGGMAAVIGLSADRVEQLCKENGWTSVDIANYNSLSQTVIAGPVDELKRIGPVFEKAGAQLYMPLPVSAAFHSCYMTEARSAFTMFLDGYSFARLNLPVISNVTGEPYPKEDPTANIRSFLTQQIDRPVLWTQSVRYMIQAGVTSFKEVGPGMVLTKLVKQIQQSLN